LRGELYGAKRGEWMCQKRESFATLGGETISTTNKKRTTTFRTDDGRKGLGMHSNVFRVREGFNHIPTSEERRHAARPRGIEKREGEEKTARTESEAGLR